MIDEKLLMEKLRDAAISHGKHTWTGNYFSTIADYVESRIKLMPKVGEWISVSERLPELRKDCLVTVKYSGFMGMHGIWIKTGHMEKEGVWRGDCCGGEVIAWMPLPPVFVEGVKK